MEAIRRAMPITQKVAQILIAFSPWCVLIVLSLEMLKLSLEERLADSKEVKAVREVNCLSANHEQPEF